MGLSICHVKRFSHGRDANGLPIILFSATPKTSPNQSRSFSSHLQIIHLDWTQTYSSVLAETFLYPPHVHGKVDQASGGVGGCDGGCGGGSMSGASISHTFGTSDGVGAAADEPPPPPPAPAVGGVFTSEVRGGAHAMPCSAIDLDTPALTTVSHRTSGAGDELSRDADVMLSSCRFS